MCKHDKLLLLGSVVLMCAGFLAALTLNTRYGELSLNDATGSRANSIAPSSAQQWVRYDYAELGLRVSFPASWQWHGEGGYKWYGTLRFYALGISPNGNEIYFQRITAQQYADRAKAAMFTTRVGNAIGYVVLDGGGESAWPTAQVAFSIDSHTAGLVTFFFHKPDDAQSTLFRQQIFVGEYEEILRRVESSPPS